MPSCSLVHPAAAATGEVAPMGTLIQHLHPPALFRPRPRLQVRVLQRLSLELIIRSTLHIGGNVSCALYTLDWPMCLCQCTPAARAPSLLPAAAIARFSAEQSEQSHMVTSPSGHHTPPRASRSLPASGPPSQGSAGGSGSGKSGALLGALGGGLNTVYGSGGRHSNMTSSGGAAGHRGDGLAAVPDTHPTERSGDASAEMVPATGRDPPQRPAPAADEASDSTSLALPQPSGPLQGGAKDPAVQGGAKDLTAGLAAGLASFMADDDSDDAGVDTAEPPPVTTAAAQQPEAGQQSSPFDAGRESSLSGTLGHLAGNSAAAPHHTGQGPPGLNLGGSTLSGVTGASDSYASLSDRYSGTLGADEGPPGPQQPASQQSTSDAVVPLPKPPTLDQSSSNTFKARHAGSLMPRLQFSTCLLIKSGLPLCSGPYRYECILPT